MKKKIKIFLSNWKYLLFILVIALLVWMPQLFYWKYVTGNWLHYSYNNEGFFFLKPEVAKVLIGFRKGWFIYTPMILFAFFGLYRLYKNNKGVFFPIFVFSILNIYIISSWTCWWYAGSFGHRAFVQSYALLSIPLGAFVYYILSKKGKIMYLSFVIMLFFVGLNLFQTWQYSNGIIDGTRMTKEYYCAVFGKSKVNHEEVKNLLLVERSVNAEDNFANKDKYFLKEQILVDYSKNFDIPKERFVDTLQKTGVLLDKDYIFTPSFQKSYKEITIAEHVFFIVRTEVFLLSDPVQNPFSFVIHFAHKGKPYKYRGYNSEDMPELKQNEWNKMEFLYLSYHQRLF